MGRLKSASFSYAVALAATAAALFARWLLNPLLDHRLPFITLYGAAAVAVWVGGWGPAVLSTVLGYLAAGLIFVETEPGSPLSLHGFGGGAGLIVYLASNAIVIGLGSGMRAARRRAEAAVEETLARERQLERETAGHRRAVEALRKKEAELELITSTTPLLLTRCTKDRRFQFVNRACADFLGRAPEDIVGRPMSEIIDADLLSKASPYIDRVLRGESLDFELEIPRSPRGRRFMHATYTPNRDERGEVIGWIASTIDVTDRKRAELALRESDERFRLMADAAPVLMWMSGTDKLCTWFNKQWLAFVGRPIEAELGNGWAEGVHAEDFDGCLATYCEAFDDRRQFSMEYRLLRHDGEYRWLIDTGIPRYGPEGEFAGYIGSCIDITERKQMEAELREADRRKDEFLATLAHELRNPLAPIRNAVEILRFTGPQTPELIQARAVIDRQIKQMALLVDDLMDVSRVTRNRLDLRKTRIDLAGVLDAAIETTRELIERSGHELVVDLPSVPVYLEADPTRLAQVFANLLNNAAKFSESGRRIELAAQQRDGDVFVSVRDGGIGIPEIALPHVFDAFVQLDQSLERSRSGLGIGLTLVKKLVEMHGGSIEAQSGGVGKGSEFIVRLPVAEPMAAASAPPRDDAPIATRVRSRVLVADNNEDAAMSLRVILEALGHETRVAHDGAEAVKAAEEFRPTAAVLDIGMPKASGYDVARQIRGQAWGKDILLMAVTGWGQIEDRQRSVEAGFDHHLVKPVDPVVVAQLLASAPSSGPDS
jgi:two-component system CheB/CheR fusion protein